MVQPNIYDKISKWKLEKDTRCESFEQANCWLPPQNERLDRGETDSQTWGLGHFTRPHLRISPSNSPSRIITIPSIRVPDQPLQIQCSATFNQTFTNLLRNSNGANNASNKIKTEIKIIDNIDDFILFHQNKEYLKNMTQKVIDLLQYFGSTINTEKSETEPKQTVIFLGREWNLANATVKTKLKQRLLLLHNLFDTRKWTKTGTEIMLKLITELIEKLNYQMLQFQKTSLFLNIMDDQKAQTARLRAWSTTMIMTK
ncbi:MAG: hypothetical protein EZS28_023847 [Streblomastix strix]|uniref:Reverse transcriptase domain-containing protein n=1 Tax=Streblomastix strix TaxID=222440 RepID=A0A5J4VDR9_9EUKA|nr:MAG: hypothetical protein EZS28_023847 [Streblomastix strix]